MLFLVVGILVIASTIFFSFRYLMKGPPFIKLIALGLVIAVCYLVIDYLIKKSKQK